ncbi:hypothetical protein [Streptomyces iconiensis]|uniref:Uncharacterized protein n=1 Tax=Streptomyces iconiensis TaxID=1384038 RepID=A0ABT6ZYB6_9ACTN|nr:hypothetical protein [Streptomyces iconiensis]MDJ1133631.1 hypothetical protein [Streptomyces iconiensis]
MTLREAVAKAPLIDNVRGVHLLELGSGWDALRVPAALGAPALTRLRQAGEQLGPVLHDAPGQRFYFTVPLGSGPHWHHVPVRLLSTGSWLVAPDPSCASEWFGRWCELPDDGTLTAPGPLLSALTAGAGTPSDRGGATCGVLRP